MTTLTKIVGGRKIYAIVKCGGKQYKVAPGQTLAVDKLDIPAGDEIELNEILLLADGEKVTVGTPTVKGAKVIATALGEERGDKIIVFKYKSKVRYRRKKGHRQHYTRLAIKNIAAN